MFCLHSGITKLSLTKLVLVIVRKFYSRSRSKINHNKIRMKIDNEGNFVLKESFWKVIFSSKKKESERNIER